MADLKRLGIWMDHANAYLMEPETGPRKKNTISSKFSQLENSESSQKGEKVMQHKEQQLLAAYYKEIGDVMKNYSDVLLFGPTSAKLELYNLLRTDHQFEKIMISVRQADKMTDKQQHAFVKAHFEGR